MEKWPTTCLEVAFEKKVCSAALEYCLKVKVLLSCGFCDAVMQHAGAHNCGQGICSLYWLLSTVMFFIGRAVQASIHFTWINTGNILVLCLSWTNVQYFVELTKFSCRVGKCYIRSCSMKNVLAHFKTGPCCQGQPACWSVNKCPGSHCIWFARTLCHVMSCTQTFLLCDFSVGIVLSEFLVLLTMSE